MGKQKIAVLGGGMSSLSAAYWLTTTPGWEDKYEITVYQYGWRLGGKAASGRNQKLAMRTEEHGFHMLFGFYENAFRTMRGCYDALGRSKDAPLSEFCAPTPEDEARYPHRYAVKRNSEFSLAENFKGEWKVMTFYLPENDLLPGDGPVRDAWQCLRSTVAWINGFVQTILDGDQGEQSDEEPGWVKSIGEFIGASVATVVALGVDVLRSPHGPMAALEKLMDLLPESVENHISKDVQGVFDAIADLIAGILKDVWAKLGDKVETDWDAYKDWVLVDFVGVNLIGALRDNLLENGFASINDQNYYEWFRSHAAVSEGSEVTLGSCLAQFGYNACFAYAEGDATAPRTPEKPLMGKVDLEAGTMLHGGARLFLTYCGSVDWLFQSGCGDALAAPLYELLERRGVNFEFFHRVTNLGLGDDEKTIDTIECERQVTLHGDEYQPLILVDGLPSWPSEPLWDQIVEGEALQQGKVNLESYWSAWKGTPRVLKRGEDFDTVILGISIAALPPITPELTAASKGWAQMLEHVKTTRTFGFQTWLSENYEKLGWTNGNVRATTGTEPAAMMADATQVIEVENWPKRQMPKDLSYFGGVMKNDPDQPPTPDPAYPPTQDDIIAKQAVRYLNEDVQAFWPDAVDDEGFKWDLLVDLEDEGTVGAKRFESQFWQANIDPSERYVLSVTGSTAYRLKTDESGFSNLYLCGDWIKNGIDSGCMEATVMSGMQASRAICGVPENIPGEGDLNTLDEGTTW